MAPHLIYTVPLVNYFDVEVSISDKKMFRQLHDELLWDLSGVDYLREGLTK